MPTNTIIDYFFNDRRVANPDGTFASLLPGRAQLVPGPGSFEEQILPQAVILGPDAPLVVDTSSYYIAGTAQFHARVVFKYMAGPPNPLIPGPMFKQYLLHNDAIPFSLYLTEGVPRLAAAVREAVVGSQATEIFDTPEIVSGKWYSADLVWDKDTLVTFLGGIPISCHGFGRNPRVGIENPQTIQIGGLKQPFVPTNFNGAIAAVKVELGVPDTLKVEVDKQRNLPRWFITTKLETTRPLFNLGYPLGPAINTDSTWTQQYRQGAISFHYSLREAAFEMHGDLWDAYKSLPEHIKFGLGYQDSDENAWTEANNRVDRSIQFSNGTLQWSQATGSHAILGQIWKDWSGDGLVVKWGFPLENQKSEDGFIAQGGVSQRFQLGTWYLRRDPLHAVGVYGAIDDALRAAGGVSKLGYPLRSEEKVPGVKINLFGVEGVEMDVRKQDFETGAAVFWSFITGGHVVFRDFKDKYVAVGGPAGVLGLPTTEQVNLPLDTDVHEPKPRWGQGFQRGIIVWNPYTNQVEVFRQFQLRLISISARPDGEKKDMYISIQIERDGSNVFNGRYPPLPPGNNAEAYWGDQDFVAPRILLPPMLRIDMSAKYLLRVLVMDDDDSVWPLPNHDDEVGKGSEVLNLRNGFKQSQDGVQIPFSIALFKGTAFGTTEGEVTFGVELV
ncbi:uncharacterized protein BDZ99DRAFT_238561 [Mytilinidion resinicola]|uniref:Uncharacterized protein n=1 Tax=Mytilinidion resinicola TaxID=574789 RepID=A0A6A6Z1E9_9PEZI|nr:uncharacterized protein BDZ99DRAFT_238561 [Mytilinidion resinicola]KAF2814493.1 hypothetical protein BDZ99DRAFT_238561 [Mytilinidion resinicola]